MKILSHITKGTLPSLLVVSALPAYADFGSRFSDLLKQRAKETVSEVIANQAARTTDRVLTRATDKVLAPSTEPETQESQPPLPEASYVDDKAAVEEPDPFVD